MSSPTPPLLLDQPSYSRSSARLVLIYRQGGRFLAPDATTTVLLQSTVVARTVLPFSKGVQTSMTIAFSRLPFNLSLPAAGFDDPWQRRHQVVQNALHQLAPLAPDGGRRVLWRCSQCQQPWFEASAASAVVPLGQEQGLELAARFGL